jgi:hypothetical protein
MYFMEREMKGEEGANYGTLYKILLLRHLSKEEMKTIEKGSQMAKNLASGNKRNF